MQKSLKLICSQREFYRNHEVMNIDDKTVSRIAKLARIKLNDDEAVRMQASLSGIFSWIEQLNEVDVTHVAPLFNVTLESMPVRQDIVSDGGYVQKILSNAPDQQADMFMVPKVVE